MFVANWCGLINRVSDLQMSSASTSAIWEVWMMLDNDEEKTKLNRSKTMTVTTNTTSTRNMTVTTNNWESNPVEQKGKENKGKSQNESSVKTKESQKRKRTIPGVGGFVQAVFEELEYEYNVENNQTGGRLYDINYFTVLLHIFKKKGGLNVAIYLFPEQNTNETRSYLYNYFERLHQEMQSNDNTMTNREINVALVYPPLRLHWSTHSFKTNNTIQTFDVLDKSMFHPYPPIYYCLHNCSSSSSSSFRYHFDPVIEQKRQIIHRISNITATKIFNRKQFKFFVFSLNNCQMRLYLYIYRACPLINNNDKKLKKEINVSIMHYRDYVFLVDVDFIPSHDLHNHVVNSSFSNCSFRRSDLSIDSVIFYLFSTVQYNTSSSNVVLVIPAFEFVTSSNATDDESIPKRMSQLTDLFYKGQARPFHALRCKHW
ncbi:hypothetical protein RFI_39357 [Reticulomyxa filosa]|uniref:Uncharacterized protein n=1 Tax=Reticulomyxa filosa TaxID=46433 RepID=X6L9E5_RETFI|nr:hypothetical protein RFI_39357 [Reticulomyxa filosa]|eukprot:ETN98158.1 hypothetical protein RFI_39357 [Reticulomyxa filosa]